MKIKPPEPAKNSPTWPHILRFAKIMEHKLSLNRHKGDRTGWLKADPEQLLDFLDDEVEELAEAMQGNENSNVILEAADVANFAMMISDHYSF